MTFDTRRCYLTDDDCRLADLVDLANQETDPAAATRQFEAIMTAQQVHRDYHLGFASDARPRGSETGPTMYLPHSQKYLPGYLAYRRPEFRQYFEAHRVQLPLRKGDAVFFNPALFHAAGANRTAGVMADEGASPAAVANVIAACAEGYPLPSNLDLDPPVDGLAPPAQADILARAAAERWPRQRLAAELSAWNTRRSS